MTSILKTEENFTAFSHSDITKMFKHCHKNVKNTTYSPSVYYSLIKGLNKRNMEYIGIEKDAVAIVQSTIAELRTVMESHRTETPKSMKDWIENSELSEQLGLSLRTLHYYRTWGVLGFSKIGNKVYYKRKDVEMFLAERKVEIEAKVKSKK